MPEIQAPDISRKLQRAFGIRGDNAVDVMAPEIVPVVLCHDLSNFGPDDAEYEKVAYGTATEAAVVGQYAIVQLLNPTGSGVILKMSSIVVANQSGPTGYSHGMYDTALTSLSGSRRYADRRIQGNTPVGQVRLETNVAIIVDPVGVLATDSVGMPCFESPYEAVLMPGTGYAVQCQTVNVQIFVSFVWKERVLLPGE